MTKLKPTGSPHPLIEDTDVPPDTQGRVACLTCHCMGKRDDARHRMPDLFDADEESRRRIGEKEDA